MFCGKGAQNLRIHLVLSGLIKVSSTGYIQQKEIHHYNNYSEQLTDPHEARYAFFVQRTSTVYNTISTANECY